MHFKGTLAGTGGRHYDAKRTIARQAGLAKLMKVTLTTYHQFIPPPVRHHNFVSNWSNPGRKTMEQLEHAGTRDLTLQLTGKDHWPAYDRVYSTHNTLAGETPLYNYDPDSRLAALWLLAKLPSVDAKNRWFCWRTHEKTDEGTPFSEEKRYVSRSQDYSGDDDRPLMCTLDSNLNALWKKTTKSRTTHGYDHDAYFKYVIPKIRAHGLQDRIPHEAKKFLKKYLK